MTPGEWGQLAVVWTILSVVTAVACVRFLRWMDKRATLRRLHSMLAICDDIDRAQAQAATDSQYRAWFADLRAREAAGCVYTTGKVEPSVT